MPSPRCRSLRSTWTRPISMNWQVDTNCYSLQIFTNLLPLSLLSSNTTAKTAITSLRRGPCSRITCTSILISCSGARTATLNAPHWYHCWPTAASARPAAVISVATLRMIRWSYGSTGSVIRMRDRMVARTVALDSVQEIESKVIRVTVIRPIETIINPTHPICEVSILLSIFGYV